MTKSLSFEKSNKSSSLFSFLFFDSLLIKYSLSYLLFYTVGLVGYYVVNIPFSDKLNSYITSYFSYSFNPSISLDGNISLLACVSYSDIRTFSLIFVAGFTMFSSIAIYALLFYHALSLGFSSLYLVNSMAAGMLEGVVFFDLLLFLFTNAAITAILILFASKTRRFNDVFRSYGGRRRLIVRSKPLYLHIFTLFVVCGAVLFINIIRFIINLL